MLISIVVHREREKGGGSERGRENKREGERECHDDRLATGVCVCVSVCSHRLSV